MNEEGVSSCDAYREILLRRRVVASFLFFPDDAQGQLSQLEHAAREEELRAWHKKRLGRGPIFVAHTIGVRHLPRHAKGLVQGADRLDVESNEIGRPLHLHPGV